MQYNKLSVFLALFFSLVACHSNAREWTFDPTMLPDYTEQTDFTLVNEGLYPEGKYYTEIFMADNRVDVTEIYFKHQPNHNGKLILTPCISVLQFIQYGLKDDEVNNVIDPSCVDLAQLPGVTWMHDFYEQRLYFQIPQAMMRTVSSYTAPVGLWDEGINAARFNYRAGGSVTNSKTDHSRSESYYLNFNPGANLGPWRIRNTTIWQHLSGSKKRWQTLNSSVERGLNAIKSRLVAGQTISSGELFDSIAFTGVELKSDDDMVPQSEYRFSPVVRGTARTQASVEVKQNDFIIHNETVSPGPFVLSNFNAPFSGGDLQVIVHESDGSTQNFSVPYNTPAIALREGYSRYSLHAGRYRSASSSVESTPLYQMTLMYGLSHGITGWGGTQGSKHFQSATVGLGADLGFLGAISTDFTQARGQKKNADRLSGNVIRLRYNNYSPQTGTGLSLSAMKKMTGEYATMADVLETYGRDNISSYGSDLASRISATLSQQINRLTLNFSGIHEENQRRKVNSDSFVFNTSLSVGRVTFNFDAERRRYSGNGVTGRNDTVISAGVSIPLGDSGTNPIYINAYLNNTSNGSTNYSTRVNGTASNSQLYWGLQHGWQGIKHRDSGQFNGSVGWTGPYGQFNSQYGHSNNRQILSTDISGGVLLHSEGITAGQRMGETVALVQAPGAESIPVSGWPGLLTDARGNALSSGLRPYQSSTVYLDPTYETEKIDLVINEIPVTPTRGAVVRARFPTRVGSKALITLKRSDGTLMPYGAIARVDEGEPGIIDEEGRVYLTGLKASGKIKVNWGKDAGCLAEYTLSENASISGIHQVSVVCNDE